MPNTRAQTTAVTPTHNMALLTRFPILLQEKHQSRPISATKTINKILKKKNVYQLIAQISTILVLVTLIVKHSKGNNKKNENSVNNVDSNPKLLHRQRQMTGTIIKSVTASVAISDISGKH